jgi:2'-5' RNA ligase
MAATTPTTAAVAERPWRCFVAVPIGEELRADLTAAVERLRDADPERDAAFRWTDPQGWHVTLAFLGSTPADAVPRIIEAMRTAAAGVGPFGLATGGLGAFPSPRRARVIWYRVADPERGLRGLARAVRGALHLEDGSAFRAHLTLARARADRGSPLDDGLLAADLPSGEIVVDRLVLYRSHRGRGPAQYESLADVPLSGAVAEPVQPVAAAR